METSNIETPGKLLKARFDAWFNQPKIPTALPALCSNVIRLNKVVEYLEMTVSEFSQPAPDYALIEAGYLVRRAKESARDLGLNLDIYNDLIEAGRLFELGEYYNMSFQVSNLVITIHGIKDAWKEKHGLTLNPF